MGFRITDDDAGVAALRQLATDLEQAKDDINISVDSARSVAGNNSGALGSYASRAEDLFDEIDSELSGAIVPLEEMKTALGRLANDLEAYIQSNGGGSGN